MDYFHYITPDVVLRAYQMGLFPMAQTRDDPQFYWVQPTWRGILPIEQFHVPRSLKKTWYRGGFDIRINTDFRSVIRGCAAVNERRQDSWINSSILEVFTELHELGYAHSVECWHGDDLVGGLYGLSIGGAFFGESMFSRAADASKLCLLDLVLRLKYSGYTLLDTQFVNEHIKRFGAVEIPQAIHQRLLERAIETPANFHYGALPPAFVDGFLQAKSQTS